jgi:hypothetical protein
MAHKTSRSAPATSMMIRGAYFYVHERRTKDATKAPIPEDQQKYEFVGLIPKLNNDPAQCANYRFFSDLAMSAVQGQEDWRGNWPAGGNWPIKNGDDRVAKYPWQAGCWVINFSTNYPPKVAILQNGVPTEIPARRIGTQDLYKSGDYCVVSTYAFTYDNRVLGVKFDLEGILFVGPGEVIGTAQRSVGDMFGSAAGVQAPSAPPMAPAAPAAPTYQTSPAVAPPPPAALPVAPVAPVAAAPASVAAGGPPMPPMAPAASAPGLPPFPGR